MRLMHLLSAAVAGLIIFSAASSTFEHLTATSETSGLPPVAAAAHQYTTAWPRCPKPAPTTAAGYTKLWASIPTTVWGGADVSISVPLPDGRVVWLYGDTLYQPPPSKPSTVTPGLYQPKPTAQMVHSSAIVQDRGCVHVNGGKPGEDMALEDSNDPTLIGWVESARPATVHGWDGFETTDQDAIYGRNLSGLIIRFRAIKLTGSCPWCFRDAGYSYERPYSVDLAGDLHSQDPRQMRCATLFCVSHAPALVNSPLVSVGPHHFTYARVVHREIRLADGGELVTTCQNWDGGGLHPLTQYRPIFSEQR